MYEGQEIIDENGLKWKVKNISPHSIVNTDGGKISDYSLNNHNHDDRYSLLSHNHNSDYSNINHTHSEFISATSNSAGSNGIVPAPLLGQTDHYLNSDGTWKEINISTLGAAAASHGNHVPTTETANNAKFLRNDNTWQTVTPANIGASASNHTHDYLPLSGGTLSNTLTINKTGYPSIALKNMEFTKGTNPSADKWTVVDFQDSTGARIGSVESCAASNGTRSIDLALPNDTYTKWGKIVIKLDTEGNITTQAPTPATSDNSTQIATTAYVKSNLSSYVAKSGDTMTGHITFKHAQHDASVNPSSSSWDTIMAITDKNNAWFANFAHGWTTAGLSSTYFTARRVINGESKSAALSVAIDASGNTWAEAPTPPTNSNDTKIATTAYVQSNLANYFPKDGGTITGNVVLSMTGITKGTAPSSSNYINISIMDKDPVNSTHRLGMIEQAVYTDGSNDLGIYAYGYVTGAGNENRDAIRIRYNASDGTFTTSCPKPPAASNGFNIATTNWVRQYCGGIVNYSLANNGWIQFQNGVIIQWGTCNTNSSGEGDITFPVSFPSASRSYATPVGTASIAASVNSISGTNSNVKIRVKTWTTSTLAAIACQVTWFAVGY